MRGEREGRKKRGGERWEGRGGEGGEGKERGGADKDSVWNTGTSHAHWQGPSTHTHTHIDDLRSLNS